MTPEEKITIDKNFETTRKAIKDIASAHIELAAAVVTLKECLETFMQATLEKSKEEMEILRDNL